MAINIPMNTLKKVIYKGTELNALDVAGCKWRKPYSFTMPHFPIGIDNVTITRSGESNCGQLTTTSFGGNSTILYGDTLSIAATPHDGYGTPTATFTGSISNRKVTGNVGLEVTAGGPAMWQTVWSGATSFGGGGAMTAGDHAKTVTIRVADLGLSGGSLFTMYPIRISGSYESGTYSSIFREVELSATYVTLGSNQTGSGTSADPLYRHSLNALARQDSSGSMFADYEIVLDMGTVRSPLVTGKWSSVYPSITLTKIEQFMPLEAGDLGFETTLLATFPEIGSNPGYTVIQGNNQYIYTAREQRGYDGYSQYSTCTIEGVEVGTTRTTIPLTAGTPQLGVTYSASFTNGTLTTYTEHVIMSTSALQSPPFRAVSVTATATFSGFGGCTVRLPVTPTGVTRINYVYTDFTNQEDDIDTSTVTQQTITVPWNYSVQAAVTCASWTTPEGSYGPWTITEDTTLPTPSLKFNASPTRTNYTAAPTQITLYYKNDTSIPVDIFVEGYRGYDQLQADNSITGLAAGSTGTIIFSGLSPSTTYEFAAYYSDPAGNIADNSSKKSTASITTDASSSQPS